MKTMTNPTTHHTLTADMTKAAEPSKVGDFLTARQLALKPHDLSRDAMTAVAKDGTIWKWSNHFNVWARCE